MKSKSISLGVEYILGNAVNAEIHSENNKFKINNIQIHNNNNSESLYAQNIVNACGAFAGQVVDMLAAATIKYPVARITKLPVEPRKRCIFVVDCMLPVDAPPGLTIPPRSTPLVVDTSGVWFRPEGQCVPCTTNTFIAGVSPDSSSDPVCHSTRDLLTIDYPLFDEIIWPSLAKRVPSFEYLKLKSAWAGFYEYNTLDQVSTYVYMLYHDVIGI